MYRLRTKPISMPQVIIPVCLLLAACGSSAASFTLHTEFTETFEQPALAIIHLFGYEKTLADAPASLIETYEIEVGQMPATLDIEIPDAAHERIDQGVGPVTADRAAFYFAVYVDVDGDAQICPGDWSQDFGVAEPQVFDGQPPSTVAVAMKLNDESYVCRPAFLQRP